MAGRSTRYHRQVGVGHMVVVDVYPVGELSWADGVPCRSGEPFQPEAGALPDSDAIAICFLNEDRVRRGRYDIFHYNMKDYHDDGPPAIDQIVEACRIIEQHLSNGRRVLIFCPDGERFVQHRPFSALCVAAHRVLMRGEAAAVAAGPWDKMDFGFFIHSWARKAVAAPERGGPMSLTSCLAALELAHGRTWIDIPNFDTAVWRNRWNTWDVSWLVPGEVQLVADPMSTVVDPDPATAKRLAPEDGQGDTSDDSFVGHFRADGVKLVVRLNLFKEPGLKESYDPAIFQKFGIDHMDASYDDVCGGCPTRKILNTIITKCGETKQGEAVAFHCKAGFGRSAVCAASLVVYRHDVPGERVLAWLRLCRPGSITTAQQAKFLQQFQGRASLESWLATEPGCCVIV